jgi:hypothetical protein
MKIMAGALSEILTGRRDRRQFAAIDASACGVGTAKAS